MGAPSVYRYRRVSSACVAVVRHPLLRLVHDGLANREAASYCAIMPDSVGLYVDNPVTHLGYPIGKVIGITPAALSVRVDFSVDDGRRSPRTRRQSRRSTSILADRALELVGNYEAGPQTVPRAVHSTRAVIDPEELVRSHRLVDRLHQLDQPRGVDNVGAVVEGIDQAVRNQGPGANKLLTTTSTVLDSPGQAIGDLGSITTNLVQLTSMLVDLEPTLKSVIEECPSPSERKQRTPW